MGRGDGVLVGGRTLEDEARRYWTTTPAGFPLARPRPRLIAHREPPKYRFHPQVLAVSVSLDHERTERSSNLCGRRPGPHRAVPSKNASAVNFFLDVPYRIPLAQERVVLALSSVDCARRVAASDIASSTQHGQQQSAAAARQQKCIPLLKTTPIQPMRAWWLR
jgi:hypothetical protein